MNEEKLLQELAEIARDDAERELSRLDRRWDDLAAGELDSGEVERLRERSRESAEMAEAYEAFQPLAPEFRSRMVEAARFQLARGSSPEARMEAPAAGARVLMPKSWGVAGAILALAASLAFFVLWPSGQPPLPGYSLESRGSTQGFRAEAPEQGEELLLAEGNRLQIVLSPDRAVEGEVEARVDLWHQGRIRELGNPRVEVSPQGAVRIEGAVGLDLTLPDGLSSLIVTLSRPGSMPSATEVESRLGDLRRLHTEDWIGWRISVVKATGGEV